MFSLIIIFLTILSSTGSKPELLDLSSKNQCIKSIVYEFITSHTCQKLSQNVKSHLAIKMTNCLFKQMGKAQICANLQLQDIQQNQCKLEGDSWNTFTIFFAHIDNLCHFYWDLSKAERTDQMVDALLQSSKKSQKVLTQNSQATKQILELQTSLKVQIMASIATQQQMADLLANSSQILNSLTSQLSLSLNRMQEDIEQNYAGITRILSAVNQVLTNIDLMYSFLVAEAHSIQGVLFFVSLTFIIFLGCLFSERVRVRRNQCLIVICFNFLVEYFFGYIINAVIGIQPIRYAIVIVLGLLIATVKSSNNSIQHCLKGQLNSERMSRIMQKAIKNQIWQIKQLGKEIRSGNSQ